MIADRTTTPRDEGANGGGWRDDRLWGKSVCSSPSLSPLGRTSWGGSRHDRVSSRKLRCGYAGISGWGCLFFKSGHLTAARPLSVDFIQHAESCRSSAIVPRRRASRGPAAFAWRSSFLVPIQSKSSCPALRYGGFRPWVCRRDVFLLCCTGPSYTVHEYSSMGRTRDLQACALMLVALIWPQVTSQCPQCLHWPQPRRCAGRICRHCVVVWCRRYFVEVTFSITSGFEAYAGDYW